MMTAEAKGTAPARQAVPSPAARRALLAANWPVWTPRGIAAALDEAAAKFAGRAFILTDALVWSYADIRLASLRAAAVLAAYGVKPGDNVAINLANYAEFAIIKFALARLGAVAVPVNYVLRKHELSYVLKQSDCVALITMDAFRDHDYLANLDDIIPGWRNHGGGDSIPNLKHVFILSTEGMEAGEESGLGILAGWPGAFHNGPEGGIDPQSTSDIIYTSGTTGRPKGVVLTHDMVLRTGYASAYARAFEPGRRVLFALPMYHVFGYVECLIACMFVGGAIIPQVHFDAEAMLTAAETHGATEIVCIPMMTLKMLDVARARGVKSSTLIAMLNSGGISPPTIWNDIRDILGALEVTTAYGMSETTASTSCTLPEGEDIHLLTTNGKLKQAGIAGDPALGGVLAVYKTIDPHTLEDLPYGAQGELLVKGPCVTKGYYNKPEENASAFRDGWLRTGDLGTVTADGYITLNGRIKETYRCGGETVMPREVEEVLSEHPAVHQVYVVGIPDAKMGEIGCACVIATGTQPDGQELIALCMERLARFKVPKHVLVITAEDVPMTATGRAQRVRLAEIARERLGLAV